MANQLYEHYKKHEDGSSDIDYHWTVYDSEITDEQLADLLAPSEIANIRRGTPNSTVSFYSTRRASYDILDRIREFERETIAPLRAALEAKAVLESKARFNTHIATLCFLGCHGQEQMTIY